jgi:tetratricopeptide (TPR) repeat protein
MPRWLSEGISVYEELERDASWGQSISPLYKEMLLGDDFVPLSELSGAFLSPASPLHLQFAYYESSLAVRYLVESHGRPLLLKLLVDLGMGVPLRDAFEQRYGQRQALDDDFRNYVVKLANEFAPDTDFGQENLPERATVEELELWLEQHPKSYFARRQLTEQLMRSAQWESARVSAEELLRLYPQDSDAGGALEMLAAIARELQDTALEVDSLSQLNEISSDNLPALLRLVTLTRDAEDWRQLAEIASRLLAVQPLIPTGHEAVVLAARKLERPEMAVLPLRALQALEPLDPARLHFQLADVLAALSRLEDARMEVLHALEQSPRYREAQQLLVSIHGRLNPPSEMKSESGEPFKEIDWRGPDNGRPPRPRVSDGAQGN